MSAPFSRKHLSAEGLLREARRVFARIPDAPGHDIALVDYLMSGLALFGLKYPSLLQFDHDRQEETTRANLKALYGVERAPATRAFANASMRLHPSDLRPLYKALFASCSVARGWRGSRTSTATTCSRSMAPATSPRRRSTARSAPRSITATAPPPTITRCSARCWCIRICREVFPLAPEPILKPDGSTKNDCERNAAKRLLSDLRREHPHLKLIVVEDGLASNAPHIRHLQALDLRFILGAKPSDHTFLFDWVAATEQTARPRFTDRQGFRHRFRYLNGVPLNDANFDLEVNFLEYWEHAPTAP